MRKYTRLLTFLGLILLVTNCAMFKNNIPKLEKNPPFKVLEATYNAWATSDTIVKWYTVKVVINNDKINLDSVFFKNVKSKFKLDKTQSNKTFISKISLPIPPHDYNLEKDAVNEFGNKPPKKTSKLLPFELNNNEAIISYLVNNKVKYYKVVLNNTETVFIEN